MHATRAVSPAESVCIHGFYGARNVGDDAILDATLQSVREVGARPLVMAWHPREVRSRFGVPAVNARGRQRELYRSMRGTKAFLLGGGGLIKDYGASPDSLAQWMRGLSVAADLGIPTMTWSVGAEPLRFPASVQRVRETLERVDVVTVRDQESADCLRDLGVQRDIVVTADPVPAFAAAYRQPPTPTERPHLVVSLRHWYVSQSTVEDSDVFRRLVASLAQAFDSLAHRLGARLTFVALRTAQGDDDRQVAADVAAQMATSDVEVVMDENPSVVSTIERLRDADAVVAMRLHAAVLASTLGVPTVALSYAPKVSSYMQQIGMEAYCADLAEAHTDWIVERVEAALSSGPLRRDLIGATDRLVDAYRQNERLLQSLV